MFGPLRTNVYTFLLPIYLDFSLIPKQDNKEARIKICDVSSVLFFYLFILRAGEGRGRWGMVHVVQLLREK